MAKRKLGGLGKGLDSLFADLPETDDAAAGVTTLPLREIEPDPDQPRKNFDEEALAAIPYFGKKSSEKYGRFILEIVHKYCKEKGLL